MRKLYTDFLPAERESRDILKEQEKLIINFGQIEDLIDAIPIYYLVLNNKRQTVFANKTVYESIGIEKDKVLGQRPGELFNCVHSDETEGGCGTTLFCRLCGTAKSINLGLAGKKNMEECKILQKNGKSLDLRVYSVPITINGQIFNIFSVLDVSSEKRKLVLERIFFHDIMNLAGSLRGWISLLDEIDPEEMDEVKNTLFLLSNNIIDEIRAQKMLLEAENDELIVHKNLISSLNLIQVVIQSYKQNEISKNINIEIDNDSKNIHFYSDSVLIKRILSNLLKNSFEASKVNSTVIIGSKENGNNIEFWVHNSTFMPIEVQRQLFQRSFSTKGEGRGLGTYSVKLLTEQYLNGKVSFVSSEEGGTTFVVQYPLDQD